MTEGTPATGPSREGMDEEIDLAGLRMRAIQVVVLLAVVAAVVLLAPGLDQVRDVFTEAQPGWLAAALAFEALSFGSYLLMFGPVFCPQIHWRRVWQIGGSELAMGSLVPASGAGGLALGAWILSKGGMDRDRIARRSVAFFLIKSSVNFFAVAIVGAVMFAGLAGPELSPLLTILPAGLATVFIVAVLAIPGLGEGTQPGPDASRPRELLWKARSAIVTGSGVAVEILRTGNSQLIAGAIGYWLFDNAVLWATLHAFDVDTALSVVLMAYLIGQLGGLLPLPGGVGGIDAGLAGALIVYGVPVAGAAVAVIAYRLALFWLPLLVGAVAFAQLRRDMPERDEFAAGC